MIAGPKADWAKKFASKGPGTVAQPRLIRAFDAKLKVSYFQVNVPGWHDEEFSALCLAVLSAGKTVFLLDDIAGVATANQTPPGLTALWTTGRAKEVPCLACHQWMTSLPGVMKSQAEVWCVYRMTNPKDLDEVAAYTGTPAMRPTNRGGIQLPRYWWWYWHVDMDGGARLMPPIEQG